MSRMNGHRGAVILRGLFVAALVLGAGACATKPTDPVALQAYQEANDPLEPLNRQIFQINRGLDFWIGKPLATTYNDLVPDFGKDRIRNMVDNLREPISAINNLFQGKWERAWRNTQRFVANSTVGLGGMFHVIDAEPAPEDFGQTLAVWGMDEGPFLMLPLMGPSNPRDTLGLVGDAVMDPFNIAAWVSGAKGLELLGTSRFLARGIDTRARHLGSLDEIERTSIDYYATIRSLYRQNRKDEILDGKPGALIPLPEISFEPLEEKPRPAPLSQLTR